MATKCFFLVFGNEIEKDFKNVKIIATKIIPSIGEEIVISKGLFKVKRKIISYKNVENYDLDDDGIGGELIYIFI